jgi:hypothetical protein
LQGFFAKSQPFRKSQINSALMSIPDRSAIPQKSATLSTVGTIRLYFRPPSTQLKPISIFLKGEFEAAHSRKVGI